jgi:hypothetical protein
MAPNTTLVHRHKLPPVDEELRATRVDFQNPQEMIVQTKDGHKIYELYPQYEFDKPEILDSFIQKVRERYLRAKFQPTRVYLDNKKKDAIARCKVVRLWEKDGLPSDGSSLLPDPEITMTLTKGNGVVELNLADYELAALSKDTKVVEIERTTDLDIHHSETFFFSFVDKKSRPL